MKYADGWAAAAPNDKRAEWRAHSEQVSAVFKEHGALQVVNCWGAEVPPGKLTSFPLAVKCEENETVIFGWILWPSREVRDAAMKKAMADPRMKTPAPFDGKRLIFGGFEAEVEI